jgi:hypothetical protein
LSTFSATYHDDQRYSYTDYFEFSMQCAFTLSNTVEDYYLRLSSSFFVRRNGELRLGLCLCLHFCYDRCLCLGSRLSNAHKSGIHPKSNTSYSYNKTQPTPITLTLVTHIQNTSYSYYSYFLPLLHSYHPAPITRIQNTCEFQVHTSKYSLFVSIHHFFENKTIEPQNGKLRALFLLRLLVYSTLI